jgi:hypothetical protein
VVHCCCIELIPIGGSFINSSHFNLRYTLFLLKLLLHKPSYKTREFRFKSLLEVKTR